MTRKDGTVVEIESFYAPTLARSVATLFGPDVEVREEHQGLEIYSCA
ncbi:hypothetical protein [Amycolatopsis coloradensis]|nr:hypothetical protein [Amycolatopsis coloradensis]